MQIKLSENIKRIRKERKMTQEQLAETMGVSVSAVYKWESGQSVPDIHFIFALAELFNTSTDVLLGYEWKNNSAAQMLARIDGLTKEKAYDEAALEAEKALKNYPNHFAVVYRSALAYLEWGEDSHQHKIIRRTIELLERSCELIDQNDDDTISEVSIRIKIANAYLLLQDAGRALQILKTYNVCGVSDARIGMLLGDCFHDAEGAEQYLGKAFASLVENIDSIMVGYANVFFQRKDYDAAIDCFRWLRTVLRGIQPEDELTRFDRYDCVLLEAICECYCMKGDFTQAKTYLKAAVDKAIRFDKAKLGEIRDMKFFSLLNLKNMPAYNMYRGTAMECLQQRIDIEAEIPQLCKLWQEIKEEIEHE